MGHGASKVSDVGGGVSRVDNDSNKNADSWSSDSSTLSGDENTIGKGRGGQREGRGAGRGAGGPGVDDGGLAVRRHRKRRSNQADERKLRSIGVPPIALERPAISIATGNVNGIGVGTAARSDNNQGGNQITSSRSGKEGLLRRLATGFSRGPSASSTKGLSYGEETRSYDNETRRACLVHVWEQVSRNREARLSADGRVVTGECTPALVDNFGNALGDDAYVLVPGLLPTVAGDCLAQLPFEIVQVIAKFLALRNVANYHTMNKPVFTIQGFTDPQFLSVDPTNGQLVVADSAGSCVVCDPRSGKVIARHSSIANCYSTAVLSCGSIIANAKGSGHLEEHAPLKSTGNVFGTPRRKAQTLKNPWGICADRETDFVYVACPLAGENERIQEFNSELEVVRRLETKDDWPHDVAVDPSRRRLLAATTGGIVAIDLNTGKYESKVVSLSKLSRPMGIDADIDGTYVCVDQSGKKLGVFDPNDHSLVHSIDLSFMQGPVGVAICPLFRRVFVSDERSGTISVFSENDEPL